MTFDFDVLDYLTSNRERVEHDLSNYFVGENVFTGRYFDVLSARSDPWRFTADDVAAVATLSVELGGPAVTELLFTRADELNALLADCPGPGRRLWDADPAMIADDSPLAKLYEALKTLPDVAYVRASKLLACKRPHLVPVRDSRVEKLLYNEHSKDPWWAPMNSLVSDPEVRRLIDELSPSSIGDSVSLLRRLDVVLWMEGDRRFRRAPGPGA